MKTVNIDVAIDLDDYVTELLEASSDKELEGEMEKRGYEIFKKSKLLRSTMNEQILFAESLKRHLCHIVEIGYFSSNEELLNAIKSRL